MAAQDLIDLALMKPEDERAKAARTYNSASDRYDDPANSFWERFGRRTVERLNLQPGMRVLDVCCGSGASALAAAEFVGQTGFVLGIDLAENLLDLARRKAARRGFNHTEFRTGDMLNLDIQGADFDAVVCVFGIFFVSDMTAAVRQLWQRVKAGGYLAITTWGPRFFEPINTEFWNSVRELRPDLYKGFHPWDRVAEPELLSALLIEAGANEPRAVLENGTHALRTPDDWWTMVLGSGYRATVDQLNATDQEQVRRQNLEFIRSHEIRAVEANVIYGVAIN
ncbi:MAG TPA: class I SAM-dependent methyltransferase [Pyrinomonadaceae bacterium]|nr:class I SAM-dependent methyltransferase [Pyrinomonadaceae bacterium]